MGYPEHLLLAWGGKLGTVEDWSCSLRLTSEGYRSVPTLDQHQYASGAIDAYLDVISAYVADPNSGHNGHAHLNWVKLNPIDAEGHYLGESTVLREQTANYASGGRQAASFQLSVAISLETGVQRGIAVAGRYFLPAGTIQPDDTGMFSETTANQLRDSAKTFIDGVNDVSGDGANLAIHPKVHVVSRGKKTAGGWGPGLARPVTGLAVGRAMDTQQRRRKKIREAWVHVDL